MAIVFIDAELDDAARREGLYRGDIFVYSRVPEVVAFAQFARQFIEDFFGGSDVQKLHQTMTPEELALRLGELKPRFIHHERSKDHVRSILSALGCDLHETYYDVPKLRTSYPVGHLNTGIAVGFESHRDTWYAAPRQQINFWLPIFPVSPDNAMAFHPEKFATAVDNDSALFDYDAHDRARAVAATFVGRDPRPRPAAQGFEPEDDLRLLPSPGGMMVFSGAQLHRTIPNVTDTSRYSIDFRTIHVGDVERGRGAPQVDVACSGTAIRDFHCAADDSAVPESVVPTSS